MSVCSSCALTGHGFDCEFNESALYFICLLEMCVCVCVCVLLITSGFPRRVIHWGLGGDLYSGGLLRHLRVM